MNIAEGLLVRVDMAVTGLKVEQMHAVFSVVPVE